MAETGKKAAGPEEARPAVVGPPPNQAVDAEAAEAVRNEPGYDTPRESSNATMRVRTRWPHSSFKMEDVPEIKAEGTMLTKTQLEKAEKEAPRYGVTLLSEEVK